MHHLLWTAAARMWMGIAAAIARVLKPAIDLGHERPRGRVVCTNRHLVNHVRRVAAKAHTAMCTLGMRIHPQAVEAVDR